MPPTPVSVLARARQLTSRLPARSLTPILALAGVGALVGAGTLPTPLYGRSGAVSGHVEVAGQGRGHARERLVVPVAPTAPPRAMDWPMVKAPEPTTTVPRPATTSPPRARAVSPNASGATRPSAPPPAGGKLAAIAECESGSSGGYSAQNPRSTASGKYQVLDSTWNGYAGYPTAASAPPAVQERHAAELYASQGSTPWNASRGCWG